MEGGSKMRIMMFIFKKGRKGIEKRINEIKQRADEKVSGRIII